MPISRPACPFSGERVATTEKKVTVTAAEFERLTAAESECLLRRRLRLFIQAGATPTGALLLAAQVEIGEQAALAMLRDGFSAEDSLRVLYSK